MTGGAFDPAKVREFAQKVVDYALKVAFAANQQLPHDHPGLVLASQHGAQCPFTQPNEPLVGKPPVDKPMVARQLVQPRSTRSEGMPTMQERVEETIALRHSKRAAGLAQRRAQSQSELGISGQPHSSDELSDFARFRQQHSSDKHPTDLFSSAASPVDPLVGGPLVNRLGNESKSEVNRLGNESKSDKHPTDRGSKGSEEPETARDHAKQMEAVRKEKRMAGLRQRQSDFRQQHSSDEHPTDLFSSAASAVDPLVGGNRLIEILSGAWKIVKFPFLCLIPYFYGKSTCDTLANLFLFLLVATALAVSAFGLTASGAATAGSVAFTHVLECVFGSAFFGWIPIEDLTAFFLKLGYVDAFNVGNAALTVAWKYFQTKGFSYVVKKLLQKYTCFCADEVIEPNPYGLTPPDKFPDVLKDATFSKEDATRIARKYKGKIYNPEQQGADDNNDEQKIQDFLKLLDTLSTPKGMKSVKILTKEENEKLIFIMEALREDRKKRLEDTKQLIITIETTIKDTMKDTKSPATNEINNRLVNLKQQVALFEQQEKNLVTRKLELDRWMRCHPQREAWYSLSHSLRRSDN